MSADEKYTTGSFTEQELVTYNNRFVDLLRGAAWPQDKGLIYILYAILRLHHLQGADLNDVLEQVKSIWMVVLQMENRTPDDDLPKQ